MNKRKSYLLLITGLGVVILFGIIFKVFLNTDSKVSLPVPPDYTRLPEAMTEQIKDANKTARKRYSSENLGHLGMVYHANTFYDEAKESYLLAINSDPAGWKWYFYLGYLFSELGDPVNAIKYFKKVTELNPDIKYASYYLGEAYVNTGNNEEAEEIFLKIGFPGITETRPANRNWSNLYPVSVYAKFRLARLYLATSRIEKTLEILKDLTEEYPDYGPGFRLLSTVFKQQGKEDLSNDNIVRANELIPFTPPLDTLIDKLALLSESPEYIMKQIDITSVSNPNWAKKLFDRAYITMPDNQFLLSKGIKIYLNMGITENLTPKLNQHIKIYENDFKELLEVATLAFNQNMFKLSSIYLEKCLVPDPKYGLIKFRLSLCYLKTGQVNESKKLVDELIADFPDSLNILSGVVSTCLMLKDINKATQVSENMGKLYPGNPEVFFVKAKIANAESNIKMADEYYLKALQGIPGDMEIISYLAKRYTDQKLWEKVFPLYKNALEKVPNEPVFLEQLGELYLNCPDVKFRNPDRARYYLERAFYSMKSKNFTRISAGKYLSKLFAQENMLDKAIKVINLTLSIANAGKVPETFIQELEDDLEVYRMLLGKPAMKIN